MLSRYSSSAFVVRRNTQQLVRTVLAGLGFKPFTGTEKQMNLKSVIHRANRCDSLLSLVVLSTLTCHLQSARAEPVQRVAVAPANQDGSLLGQIGALWAPAGSC